MKQAVSRTASVIGTILAALVLGITMATSAAAAGCTGFGCDGHDPNIQTWQQGPNTTYGPDDVGNSFTLELRWGKTDGDDYSWGRLRFPNASGGQNWKVSVDRCPKSGGSPCAWGLGVRYGYASGWSAASGANYTATRTPMYYNPSTHMMRACATNPSGDEYCTAWY
ncbi:hypothetical protein [Streptomyces sp. NBC_00096]|uniref:hypothetical protein n=1 Tax=Streptomyces sp. NBC_00096 TaxID=2975650 RepID=UPI00324E8736